MYPPFRTSLSLSDLHTHVMVLHSLTPFELLVQTAVLFFNSPIRIVFNEHNIRFRTKLRHLTYWLKWRVHSAIIGGSIHVKFSCNVFNCSIVSEKPTLTLVINLGAMSYEIPPAPH